MDILKEDSGVFELLTDDESNSNNGFTVRKQNVIYTGLETQGNWE